MPQQQQHRPSAGDFTGREKAKAAHDQAQAIKDRQSEISMLEAVETEEESYGVFDPRTGERLNEPNPSAVAVVVDPEPEVRFGREMEPTFSGKEAPEVQVVQRSERRPFTRAAGVALNPFVTIRVDQDIEEMTFGMVNGEPNNYNFKEGLQYKVPREVAEHLNERGLVRQWITS